MAPSLRTFFFQIFPVLVTFLLLVTSFILLSVSTKNPDQSSAINTWLIPLNIAVLVILTSLILYNVVKALVHLRSKKAGSRFTLRLMYAFSLLTILPVLVVSYFSMNFIGDRVDNWFNVKIEGALDDSLELARSSLDVRMRQHLFNLERAGTALKRVDTLDYGSFLDRQLIAMGAYEIVLFGSNKRVLVYSGEEMSSLLPHFPTEDIIRKLSSRGYMYQLEPVGEGGLFSRVALNISLGVGRETFILTALFPFSEKERILADSVQDTYKQYQEISYQKELIKRGFRITLLLIMLLSILFSVWAAFIYSIRLTKPVRRLLEATNAVASGDLQKKLDVDEKDDFSLLARSFNVMTTKLSRAQKESADSQQEVQRQHDYLNVVLGSLTSGVITLDEDFIIRRINHAAEELLDAPLDKFKGKRFKALCSVTDGLLPFYGSIMPKLMESASSDDPKDKDWQTEVTLMLGNTKHTLVCRGVVLPELIDGAQGYLLVIDDISEVVQAEHDAAWGEVARRLAHEIKNPLTPIRLSAERLQRRLKPLLDQDSAELLERMSNTIVHQVDSMKTMVDAFSEYARIPELKLKKININGLIREVVELYRINQSNAEIILKLEGSPILNIDGDRIRQLLVNLIKNSLDAMHDFDGHGDSKLSISSKVIVSTKGAKEFVLVIEDNGPGIVKELLPHLFEPYKTTKTKGGGLGLAIVKRIIEEHDGNVLAKNNENGGASFTMYLPYEKDS
ncbi:ATP-binding protein [uncultured Cocleimonas sp.]|uniref:ATP-binding protein n=1 Tax=uncultured Cocleimonas sp. TaxID=1051587 RepID=UPI00261760B7|nr:ATP-binding protein [uncultured Cocleimonas sp.]